MQTFCPDGQGTTVSNEKPEMNLIVIFLGSHGRDRPIICKLLHLSARPLSATHRRFASLRFYVRRKLIGIHLQKFVALSSKAASKRRSLMIFDCDATFENFHRNRRLFIGGATR
jgi:hypothetical protein